MQMKKVYIEWHDSYTTDTWQNTQAAIAGCRSMMLCKSIGYMLDKNKKNITFCHTLNEEGQVTGVMHIPVGCIKKMKVFKK
jgi:hypothetical protein